MRRAIAVPIALVFFFLSGITAGASQPQRIALQFPPSLPLRCFTANGDLLFAGTVTAPVNNEILTIYEDTPTSFRASITGHLVLTYTNPTNGKSVTVNASGPAFDSFRDGTEIIISTGLNASNTIHAGRLGVTIDANGFATFTAVGHTLLDICAALA
jgi:hypothetical protein